MKCKGSNFNIKASCVAICKNIYIRLGRQIVKQHFISVYSLFCAFNTLEHLVRCFWTLEYVVIYYYWQKNQCKHQMTKSFKGRQ